MAAAVPLHDDPHLHAPGTPVADAEAPLLQAVQAPPPGRRGDEPDDAHPRLHLNAVEGGLAAAGGAGGASLAPPSPGRAEKRLVSGVG